MHFNEVIAAGETTYNRTCAVCHGNDGISLRPDTYLDLRRSSRMGRMVSKDDWSEVVRGGTAR